MLTPLSTNQGTQYQTGKANPPTIEDFFEAAKQNDRELLATLLQNQPETKYVASFLRGRSIEEGVTNSDSAVRKALIDGQLDWVRFFINNDVPLIDDIFNRAAAYGHLDIVELCYTKYGHSRSFEYALTMAANAGKSEVVDFLVAKGVRITSSTIASASSTEKNKLIQAATGVIPPTIDDFIEAAKQENTTLLSSLLDNEQIIDSRYLDAELIRRGSSNRESLQTKCQALLKACQEGQLECALFLIKHGVPIAPGVLKVAAEKGYLEIFQLYFKNCPWGDKSHTELLKIAAEFGHLAIVKLCKDFTDGRNDWQERAMHGAAMNGHIDVVDYLVTLGYSIKESAVVAASPEARLTLLKKQSTPIVAEHFLDAASNKDTEYLGLLLLKRDGFSLANAAMQRAANDGNAGYVDFFIKNGVPIQESSIIDAARLLKLEVIKIYFEHTAVENRKWFINAMMLAERAGPRGLEMVAYLESQGIHKIENAVTNTNSGSLEDHLVCAVKTSDVKAVKFLTTQGAVITRKVMEHASHEMKLILAECPNFTPTANDYLDATKSEHLHGNKYNNRALFALLLKKDPNHAVANEALNILVKKEFGPFNSGGFPEAKILIQHGVQVNEKNVNLAAQRGYLKMVELFFSAIPKEQHKSYGKALEIAERSWKTTSVVNYLKSLGIEKPGVKHAVNISTSSPERVTKSGNASPSVVMPNTPEQRAVLLGILARVAQANSQQTSTKPTATPTVSFAETKDKNPSEGQLYKAKSICSKDGRFTISANKRLLISDSISLVSDEQLEELGIVEFKRSRSGIDNYVTVEISRL